MGLDALKTRLQTYIQYDPSTGYFYWASIPPKKGARTHPRTVGSRADYPHNERGKTYMMITVGDGKQYRAHRIAWLIVYGRWPEHHIDHINGDSTDNRIENLREATNTENCRASRRSVNNQSGYKGVYFCNYTKRWRASICVNGKTKKLGRFNTPAEAHEAYKTAAIKYFGEFARFA